MGYRSDVAYVVQFYHEFEPEKAFADYLNFVNWVKNEHEVTDPTDNTTHNYDNELKTGGWAFNIHPKDLMLSFEAEGVKWYETYKDVQWHEQLLDKVHRYDTGNYRFVRIGEEYEDVEVKDHSPTVFEMWEHVDVHRSIYFSPPHETEDNEGGKDESM